MAPPPAPVAPRPMAPPPAPVFGAGPASPMQAAAIPGGMIPAPLGPRFLAAIIDGLIVGIPIAIVCVIAIAIGAFLASRQSSLASLAFLFVYLLIPVLVIGYHAYFEGLKGATMGNKVMK